MLHASLISERVLHHPLKASVLINNYNYARFLPEALASITAQTHPAHEIIVVDDGSKDESLQVLESLRETTPNLRVHAQPNGGQLSAMRAGIELATGDWCFFLDADDSWDDCHIANAASAIAKHPEAGVWYSGHRETEGPALYRSKWPAGPAGPFPGLVSGTGVRIGTITSTIALRQDFAIGIASLPASLNEDWRIRADDVLLYASAFAGAIFHHSMEESVCYRIHGDNAFAHNDAREVSYRKNKKRLFDICRELNGIDPARHLKLMVSEVLDFPPERRNREALRRYRRAIRRLDAPFAERLSAYFSTYR